MKQQNRFFHSRKFNYTHAKKYLTKGLWTTLSAVLPLIFMGNATAQLPAVTGTAPPEKVTAFDFINLFEQLNGAHPGMRKAHAAGVCASGVFTPNKDAKYFANSMLMSGEHPATIRFSIGSGVPTADERVPGARGMGLQIDLPNGTKHMLTGNSTPVFAAKDPETFFGLLQRLLPAADGKPDMARLGAYIAANPSTQAAAQWSRTTPAPASYANTPYFGLHTFFYTNQTSKDKIKFRWHVTPDLGQQGISKEQAAALGKTFLADKLQQQLSNPDTDVSFTVHVQIGEQGDTNVDPSQKWDESREKVVLGKLTVKQSGGDACNNINFDPNIMSTGFSSSDDPVLKMRSPAYGISFGKRLSNQ